MSVRKFSTEAISRPLSNLKSIAFVHLIELAEFYKLGDMETMQQEVFLGDLDKEGVQKHSFAHISSSTGPRGLKIAYFESCFF